MTPYFTCFLVVFCLFYIFSIPSFAIFDPKLQTTTKPPEHRESVLPWFSHDNENKLHIQTQSRSPKRQEARDDISSKSAKDWSPWRKPTRSEIEQRTQIDEDYVLEKLPKQFPEQELDKFEQQENLKSTFESQELLSSDKKHVYFKDKSKYKNRDPSYNTINFEDKYSLKNKDAEKKPIEFDNEYFYEGVDIDSTKPRKENILLSMKQPQHKIARYDSHTGVQCPEKNSTGQFVYPPDCKFFVNCWKGRAVVQPCAPGTHFNPDTLECDFPHKVKCYEDEFVDYKKPLISESQINRKLEKLQEPKCPPYLTGLLPHHGDCTKFIQCANGATYIMDCGPGTVFNPAMGICDWPRNVKGCEDTFKSDKDEEVPLIPSNPPSHAQSSKYIKKITCPEDFTGLLPHPDTCKKFLQCANGATYVMDCGPGTAFNPVTTVCDWPYNVPGCKTVAEESNKEVHRTGSRAWSSPDRVRNEWSYSGRYNHTMDSHRHGSSPGYSTVTSSIFRPTWRPSTTTSSSRWIPMTTTVKPPYGSFEYIANHHNQYSHKHEGNQYKDHGPYRSNWESSGGNIEYPFNRDYGSHGDHNRQWVESQGADKDRQSTEHFDHSEESWTSDHRNKDHQYDDKYQFPGHHHHHHHHHHHYHNSGPAANSPVNLDAWSSGNSHVTDDSQKQEQHYPGYIPSTSDTHGHPDHDSRHDPRYHDHRHFDYATSDKTDQRQFQPHFPPPQYDNDDDFQVNRSYNRTRLGTEGNLPANRRTGYTFTPNRQEYSNNSRPVASFPVNPDSWSSGNPHVTDDSQKQEQEYPGYIPSTSDSHGHPGHDSRHDPRYHDHRHFDYSTSDETDQRQFQPHFPPRKYDNDNDFQVNRSYNRTRFGTEGNLPANRRTGYTFTPNRQEHSRMNPVFHHPGFNYTSSSTVPVTSGNKFDRRWNRTQDGLPQEMLPPPRTRQENITWSQPENESSFKPSMWNPGVQGMVIQDDELDQWQSGSDLYQQSTVNRETDAKMTHWTSGTNIPLNPKGQVEPDEMYANVNGTRDYFITKTILESEIINQPQISHKSIKRNDTFNNVPHSSNSYPNTYSHNEPNNSADAYYPPIPATELQPPPYRPVNNYPMFLNMSSGYYVHWKPHYSNYTNSTNNRSSYTPTSNDFHPVYNRTHDRPNALPLAGVDSDNTMISNITTSVVTERSLHRRFKLTEEEKIVVNGTRRKEESNVHNMKEFSSSSVSIEDADHPSNIDTSNVDSKFPSIAESETNDYGVDILDDKHVWKPKLVFQNKTETTTVSSVIMRIGPKKTDVELFNIEEAPFHEKEPPFPVYYVKPVQPLTYSKKPARISPLSGQTIRLRGGLTPRDGYVEVQGIQPGWGIICDSRNSWTLKEAHIVCRQLGYIRGAEMAWQGRNNRADNDVPTWIAANTVTCFGNETRFQSCKFTHKQECRVDRDAIGVRCVSNRIAHCHKDEIPHEGQCYHFADTDSASNHAEALEYCTRRNSRLIDITGQAENNFVSEWLLQSYPEVSSIMTSGFGFTTMNRPLWLWEDSARAKFKFTKWWPGWMDDMTQPPSIGSRPLCIVMKRNFPCYERPELSCTTDYFFWDTEDCTATSKGHSVICKRPYDDIGCVYGKGNQYTGKANITLSGNGCLPWADERIAHQLRVNVVNKEIRDRLRMHNYCRNPNPLKESRPWCYTVSEGIHEYCDIPACGNIDPKRSILTGQCKPKHFECTPGECIPSPWVCDGEEDCTNGADERTCVVDLNLFEKSAKHKLDGYDVEKWLNTPLKTCALRCKEADFTCRSFNHKSEGNICLLSDSNIGLTGALKPDQEFDYYEMKERSVNCDGMYTCNNRKCINQTLICNGKNDCDDRSDENICTAENLDYSIRLAGANNSHEGRIEVKILGHWGQVCDDGFGMINADVICKELGFTLGALEVRPGGFYGNLDPPTRFMVDQLKCRGDEITLRDCDFNGWGVHNCQPEEAVGIVCKTAVNICQEGHWKCDNSPACIPTPFICDEVVDCPDHSDESPEHCDAPFELRLANGSNPMEGRVELRHHGVWGTVCDDDFTNAAATVICRSLGYFGIAIAKKDGFFGSGQGPIWLDEVYCHGNESQLYRCEHNHWGQHNCDHNEDAGVICSPGDIKDTEPYWENGAELPERNIEELLPTYCGKRAKDFNDEEDLIFAKVVHGSIAPKGTYPWQASIRVRRHSRSSHWCGAVVISPVHVLTAAHCLEGYNKASYFVRAGDYNTDIDEGTEVEANIEDYYVHEEFRKGHRMNNDIALVLLKGQGIPLGKDIMPICLPYENTEYSPGLNCTISGFGSIETGKTTQSRDLRYGWVPLLDQSICRAGYVYGDGAISAGMMCAGYLDEGVDTCDGDSGGPLACYHNGAFTLYGITSWGQHCGQANKPGVYVRVAYYRRWIDQKIRESLAGR